MKSEPGFSVPNVVGIKRQASETAAMSSRLEETKESLTQSSRKREVKQDTKLEAATKNLSSQQSGIKIKHEPFSKK